MVAAQVRPKHKAYNTSRVIREVTSCVGVPILVVVFILPVRIIFDFVQMPQLLENVFEYHRQVFLLVNDVLAIIIDSR